jgi:hypothetical protein
MQLMRWSRCAGILALLLLVITSSSGVRFYLRHPQFSVDWRGAIQYLLPRLQPGDHVAINPYVRYLFDYYRDIDPHPLPPFTITATLPQPPTANYSSDLWLLAPVARNPDDPASGPAAAQAAVQDFVAATGGSYCAMPPQPSSGSVQVWQIRPCGHG